MSEELYKTPMIERCARLGLFQDVARMIGKSVSYAMEHYKPVEVRPKADPNAVAVRTKPDSGDLPEYVHVANSYAEYRIAPANWRRSIRQRVRALKLSLAQASAAMGRGKDYISKLTNGQLNCSEAVQAAIEAHIRHLEGAEAIEEQFRMPLTKPNDDAEWCAIVRARIIATGLSDAEVSRRMGRGDGYVSILFGKLNPRGIKARAFVEHALGTIEATIKAQSTNTGRAAA